MSRPGSSSGAPETPGGERGDRELIEAILARKPRALGRGISRLEAGGGAARELVAELYSRVGRAKVVGFTGPPGAGKSTLVERLAGRCRGRQESVGILAVDPTSPFTGGALLGDRVRMQRLYTDPGVFIRSMATRGALGGLARTTRDAVDLLDAAGFDWVFVETVGVGQDEVDIVRSVDTVVVVTVPGLGDDIQTIKAGLMEIADIFVVNKADRSGVDRVVRDLSGMLDLGQDLAWRPPVLPTVASQDQGIEELLDAIEEHRRHLGAGDELEERRFTQLRLRVENILKERILKEVDELLGMESELRRAFKAGEDPHRLAERLFAGTIECQGDADEEPK